MDTETPLVSPTVAPTIPSVVPPAVLPVPPVLSSPLVLPVHLVPPLPRLSLIVAAAPAAPAAYLCDWCPIGRDFYHFWEERRAFVSTEGCCRSSVINTDSREYSECLILMIPSLVSLRIPATAGQNLRHDSHSP
jgi:hypothetical protein